MAEITRICPVCKKKSEMDNQFCPHCGHKVGSMASDAGRRQMPVSLAGASFPLLAGAAGLLIRIGWKVLQSKTTHELATRAIESLMQSGLSRSTDVQRHSGLGKNDSLKGNRRQDSALKRNSNLPSAVPEQNVNLAPKRSIKIRSHWAVQDGSGMIRRGQSEHTIEIDDF